MTQRSADAQTENRRKRSEEHCIHAAEAVTSSLDLPESQENMEKQKEGTRVEDFQIYKDFSMLGGKKQLINNWKKVSVSKGLF